MMTISQDTRALTAVRLARQLAAELRQELGPDEALPHATLSATLRRLEAGEILDRRDDHGLALIQSALERGLAREVTGSEVQLYPAGSDSAEEEVCAFWRVPTYTTRGQRLAVLGTRLAEVRTLRQGLVDKAAADRTLTRLAQ